MFDTKRWLCEDTVHTHLHGHKDTVSDPEYIELVNKCWIVECVTKAGILSYNDLPGTTALRSEQVGAEFDSDSCPSWDGADFSAPEQSDSLDWDYGSSYSDWDGYSS